MCMSIYLNGGQLENVAVALTNGDYDDKVENHENMIFIVMFCKRSVHNRLIRLLGPATSKLRQSVY